MQSMTLQNKEMRVEGGTQARLKPLARTCFKIHSKEKEGEL